MYVNFWIWKDLNKEKQTKDVLPDCFGMFQIEILLLIPIDFKQEKFSLVVGQKLNCISTILREKNS